MSRYTDDDSSQYSYGSNSTYISQQGEPWSLGSRSKGSWSTGVSGASQTRAKSKACATGKPKLSIRQSPSFLDSLWGWYEDSGEFADDVEEGPQEEDFDEDSGDDSADSSVHSDNSDQSSQIGTNKSCFVPFQKYGRRMESPHRRHESDNFSQATLESDSVAAKYLPRRRNDSGRPQYERDMYRGRAPVSTEERLSKEDRECQSYREDGIQRRNNQPSRENTSVRERGGHASRPPRPPRTRESEQRHLPPSKNVQSEISNTSNSYDEQCQNDLQSDRYPRPCPTNAVKVALNSFEKVDQCEIIALSQNYRDEPSFIQSSWSNAGATGMCSLGARKRFASLVFRRAASFDGVLAHDAAPQKSRSSEQTDSAAAPKEAGIVDGLLAFEASNPASRHETRQSLCFANSCDFPAPTPVGLRDPRSPKHCGDSVNADTDTSRNSPHSSVPLQTMTVDRCNDKTASVIHQKAEADSVGTTTSKIAGRIREVNKDDQVTVVSPDIYMDGSLYIPWE